MSPHTLPAARPRLLWAGLPLLLSCVFFVNSCATARQLREDVREIEAEHEEAERRLAETPVSTALLDIARHQDGRRGTAAIGLWARHPSVDVRVAAYRALGLIGGEDAASRLAGGLEDEDPAVRRAAAFGFSLIWGWPMSKLQSRQLQERYAGLLDPTQDPEYRRAYVVARAELALAGDPEWSSELLEGEVDSDYFMGFALLCRARTLVGEGLPELPVLPVERVEAAGRDLTYALAQCGPAPTQRMSPELVDGLLKLTESSDGDRAVWAWRALSFFDAALVVDAMSEAVGSSAEPRRRLAALRAAARLGEGGLPVLRSSLALPESLLAVEASALLGRSAQPEAWDALAAALEGARALEHPAARVQLEALAQLSASPSSRGSTPVSDEMLTAALDSGDVLLRRAGLGLAIALAAEREDPEELEGILEGAGTTEDPGMGVVVALALAKRKEDVVEGALLERLGSEDVVVAAIAAQALGERGGDHVTQRLIEAWEGASAPDRWELREALVAGLLARDGVPTPLILGMREDENPHVRMAIFQHAIDQSDRADLGLAPQERPLPELPDASFGVGDVTGATVVTSAGSLEILLFPAVAPGAVHNFVSLSEQGFFDGLIFHRVVPDFVVQTGDPLGTGWGGPGYTIRDEFSNVPYLRGSVGMARSGKDTAGSQWFITHSRQPHLDRHYTHFGQLVSGWDALDAVEVGDHIESITIHRESP